jgi:DNA-directed RNA polymerase
MQQKWLPSYIHNLDATHLHLIVNKWDAEGLGPIVTIHDSFGMHPNSVQRFREIARETFIELHKTEPLRQFYQQCGVEVPDDYPTNPEFDLEKVGLNMFSF